MNRHRIGIVAVTVEVGMVAPIRAAMPSRCCLVAWTLLCAPLAGFAEQPSADPLGKAMPAHFERYCFDCHADGVKKGGLDMPEFFAKPGFDGKYAFENLITGKMPPQGEEQPGAAEKQEMLKWLAAGQSAGDMLGYRRLSRHEFTASINDLLGTNFDVSGEIPEDRGTRDFDSDQRIHLTSEQMSAYFSAADQMLEFAFPVAGFHPEQVWTTNAVRKSNSEEYSVYTRKYREGNLYSWFLSKIGNPYSYFFDDFEVPVKGWYDLTFDAAKIGDFPEDISVVVFAGKFYDTDARTQPQRLLEVISLGGKELKAHTIRALLNPGENISVHCQSKHTYKQRKGEQGAYIEKLTIRGPVFEQWPPTSYQSVFAGLPVTAPEHGAMRKPDAGVAGTGAAPVANSGVPAIAPAPMSPVTVDGSEQDLRQVVRHFAEKAFVSKLSEQALAPFQQLSLEHFKVNHDFVAAAKAGMKAIISSPRFLLVPGEYTNSSQERAAILSRTLWLSVPDTRLAELAAADKLTGSVLRKEIGRMLDDPKHGRMIHSFCAQWLNLRGLNKVSPSLKLYPDFDVLLNHYLPLETEAYIAHLIGENLPVSNLIDSDFAFLNQRLAQHYGVEGIIGQDLRKVTLPKGSPRGGLMTMGSTLKVTTDGFQTSPILRGAWVSKNIVGTTLSPPPPGAGVIEPDHHSAAKTLKEQIEEHKKSKSCFACHKEIDPYGFALESFDATGAWREKYRVEKSHSKTFEYSPAGWFDPGGNVDPSGEINDKTFAEIKGLKELLLSDHKKLAFNLMKKFFEYANGYQPTLQQRMELYAMIPEKATDCRVRDLIFDVLIYSLGEKP